MTVEEVSQQQNKYVGKVFPTKSFGDLKVLKYNNTSDVEVEFINTGGRRSAWVSSIMKGEVRDTSVCKINKKGFMDLPNELRRGKHPKSYTVWNGMLQRCYNENMRDLHPTYTDCTTSETFKYFSKFKTWYEQQKGCDKEGWHLDKDILVKGNKVYSETTCCFVPPEINTLILNNKATRGSLPIGMYFEKDTGKYKVRVSIEGKQKHIGRFKCKEQAFQAYALAKKEQVRFVADKWKDQIDQRVYEALMNWEIEIDD